MDQVWIMSCTKSMAKNINDMRNQGMSYADISARMGFDKQRVAKFHRLFEDYGPGVFANDRGKINGK